MNAGTVFKLNPDGTGFSLLHSFSYSDTTDGTNPYGSLVGTGTTLYGETINGGGASLSGALFKIATDGTGFTLLHSFAGGAADGRKPQGTPVLSGTTLYGTTGMGGSSGAGTVFKIATDGTGFALLHSFAGGATDGANLDGSLIASGSTFYGMSSAAGSAANGGTVFKLTIACGADEHVATNV